MKRIAIGMAVTMIILMIWGAWLAVETVKTLTKMAETVAEVQQVQEANRQALKINKIAINEIRVEQANQKGETWNIKHYTCIDDQKRPGDQAYCITKDGTKLTPQNLSTGNRIIAVKPGRLPLGSWVHIEGIGKARVADWGNLQSNEMDLWVGEQNKDEAIQMGVQPRKVTILK
jgi:3D (Asp-Asp-Asp) domain-containing protein